MIRDIANTLNDLAQQYEIGQLQDIRKRIKSFNRRPGSSIFGNNTISDEGEWAFHFGGRKELQFNIGFEEERFRYGVALSLKSSQSLPDITLLYPKARRLNEFIRQNPDFFSEYSMWYWLNQRRSEISTVREVTDDLLRPNTFIFIGKLQNAKHINYKAILGSFDELLKPYVYVEKTAAAGIIEDEIDTNDQFRFDPKKTRLAQRRSYTLEQKSVDLSVRHSLIQQKMSKRLEKKYGSKNVSVEQFFCGKKIDIVLRVGDSYHFFEIKTSGSAKACIRDALGQLMEYAYWPGRVNADKIVVVGEEKIDEKTKNYLSFVRNKYSLPIEYHRIKIG